MAIWREFTEDEQRAWDTWVASRPAVIQDLARRFPVNRLFRLVSSGQRCYPYSYSENGTLTVIVDGRFNRVLFGRRVFGIPPEEMVECELPAHDEDVGDIAAEAGYSEDDVRKILIPRLRDQRKVES